uniref:RE1-silencing transcription factor n=1 Tax=Cacopsylla melanoneura TaxID=428564 RepID=A0A8D9ADG7_9HEMI
MFSNDYSFLSELYCQYCGCELYSNAEQLLYHSKSCSFVSRLDKSYLYVCLFCDYHSFNSGRMRTHIRIHLGDKSFKCQFCIYATSQKSHLTRHIKIKHA